MIEQREQNYFEIPEEALELRKQLEMYSIANESLTKDYQTRGQEITHLKGIIAKLEREKEEAEKQLNDIVIHTQTKAEQMRQEKIINVPFCQIRNMFRFEEDPTFIYIAIDGNGNRLWMKSPIEYERWQQEKEKEKEEHKNG